MPNDEYIFELPVGSLSHTSGDDPAAWQPLDRIELTSLMWQDGVVEGDKETARQQHASDRQRAAHIRALLELLREWRGSITTLRDNLARTRPQDLEVKEVWERSIQELDRFERRQLSSDGLNFSTWLGRTVSDLEQWLARIVVPKL